MKLLPLMFYLFVFEPKPDEIKNAVLTLAAGFATFENICYLIEGGAENLDYLLIRGLGAGANAYCLWSNYWLWACLCMESPMAQIAGTLGLLGASIAFHGTYNLLISYGSWVQHIAYALPIATVMIGVLFDKLFMPRLKKEYK